MFEIKYFYYMYIPIKIIWCDYNLTLEKIRFKMFKLLVTLTLAHHTYIIK